MEERYTGNPWVYFGADNLFLENMRTLADNCVPLQRCIEMAAMFIAGKGIKFVDEDGEEVPEAQARFQQWMNDSTEEDFLYATALDIALANAKAWVVRRAYGGAIARIDHMDVSRVRSGKLEKGKVKEYYFSASWLEVQGRGRTATRYKPEMLHAFEVGDKRSTALMYSKTYKQGRDHYGEPWYLPAVADCEVWAKVPVFNKTQIDTGFKPAVHLHTFIEADTKDLDQYDKDIEDAYTGAAGRGIFHTFGTTEEGAPILNVLARGDHAGELDEIREKAEAVIVRAYGVPDILYRMDVVGGLTAGGNVLKAAVEQFQEGFVKPKQRIICKDLVRLMNEDGIKVWDAEIEELELFSDDQISETIRMAVMTRDEMREDLDLPPLGGEVGNEIPGKKVAAPAMGQPMPEESEEEDEQTPEDDGVL